MASRQGRARLGGPGSHSRSRSIEVLVLIAALSIFPLANAYARSPIGGLFETERERIPGNAIDSFVEPRLRACGLEPAPLCSDEVFVRRVHLDVIGTLPLPKEVRRFLADRRTDKRAALVDELLKRDEFADYWSLKWCDLLRVKSEFPGNLWPNAVQAYHRWVHDAIRENWPYDRFARELLTSSGSNFRVAPVNFYRAIQSRQPSSIAEAVALSFMGTRIAKWPEAQRLGMASFFTRVVYKSTSEWKEEIVELDPAATLPLKAVFPDGSTVKISPDQDPRRVFADWLVAPQNPWFARNVVNRVWSWLLGHGIIHEPDDIRPDNPPVLPELLSFLEKELVNARYDLVHVYRLILNSRTYQQSSIVRSEHPAAESLFARYPVRQLDAGVLIDAICGITGVGEDYWSSTPEPFTFIPESQRTITLADGSITSSFLEMFGRPARDTGLESERRNQPTEAQRLHLLNSTHIQRKIARSERLRRLVQTGRRKAPELIRLIYLGVLSRNPTEDEMTAVESYCRSCGLNPLQIGQDLVWALFNTKEFLCKH